MQVIRTISEMQEISMEYKKAGNKIALVPTMGFLHHGHLSLIKKAKELSDIVITTIFVNPKQFAPHEDFDSYPRDFSRDSELAQDAGTDILFIPDILSIYPKDFTSFYTAGKISKIFDGEFRPDFFDGVAMVCIKLFNITNPDITVFGQKDYQQSRVINKIIKELNFNIQLHIQPTIREANGLAMSSRNVYLSSKEKEKSSILFIAMEEAKREIQKGEKRRKIINAIMHKTLRTVPEIKIDYAASALSENFDTPEEFLPGDNIVLLLAVYLGKTRLIDNSLITIPSQLHKHFE